MSRFHFWLFGASCVLAGVLVGQLLGGIKPAQADNPNYPGWANDGVRELRLIREELHGLRQDCERRR